MVAWAEKRKGPNNVATLHLKKQLERWEGMKARGRFGPNPDGVVPKRKLQ